MARSGDEIVLSDVASAGLAVSRRIAEEAAAEVDLLDALRASRSASHPYSSYPKEWPSLVEVAENQELPLVLVERYNAAGGEGTALCGIFPEIHRAWASVDTSLFLWHFNKRDGQCTEYGGSEQAICAVGFVRPSSGIFLETIEYLVVLATPIEILLVGVCYTGNGDKTNPYTEVSLQTLPEYKISSDGVVITTIASTEKGRIFMGGRDGHVYELQYSRGLRWQSQCRKICVTSGLTNLVSRWIMPNVLKIGSVDPVVDLVVDNERQILYARTEDMKVQVFDMGVNGDAAVKRITEEKNLLEIHDSWSSKSDRASQAAKPCITCMSPLSTTESKLLHLVAVLSDGRRLYLSTLPVGNNDVVGNLNHPSLAQRRPCCLKVLEIRPSPPFGISGFAFGAISAVARAQPNDFALKVETAFSSAGTTVLSHSSTPAVSSLMIINKDSSLLKLLTSSPEIAGRSSHALFEISSSLPLEGRMLMVADVYPMLDLASSVHALYSDTEDLCCTGLRYSCQKAFRKLSARGDLSVQHILPRRRVAVFSTMGVREVVFNRPIEILRRMLDSNAPRFQVKDFLNHFGAGEAAAMCLTLAAKLLYTEETPISTIIAERAGEILEDSSILGIPQLDTTAFLKTKESAGVSSMEQVSIDEPVFSSVHQGILLCSSRLLFPIWERPVFIKLKEVGSGAHSEGPVVCRLPVAAMEVLGNKIHSLEQLIRCKRIQGQGLYGNLSTLVDLKNSGFNHNSSDVEACLQIKNPSIFTLNSQTGGLGRNSIPNKSQVSPQNAVQLIAMEVKAIECLRRLLRRSGEALFLLQVVSSHHLSHVVRSLNSSLQKRLIAMTFDQLVCSEEGQQLAIQLISGLMECCIRLEDQKTVDDLSMKLKEGSPSYFDDSISKYFQAVECIEAASRAADSAERERLARNAYSLLKRFPECADLSTVCKKFEDLRFYEAVVHLPLQTAQALDPNDDALNDKIDPQRRDNALLKRGICYKIITNVLRALKSETGQKGPQDGFDSGSEIEQASRKDHIHQVVQLSAKWPDTVFHEHLYGELIDLGLEDELLEYGGPDLVLYLQNAGRMLSEEVQTVTSLTSGTSGIHKINGHAASCQTKYLDLLARYYVLKRQHILAAHVLYRLAERQCHHLGEGPSLEERHRYLSNAVLQANNAISIGVLSSTRIADDGLVDMLEAKLTVLQFQIKIKEELESITELETLSSSNALPQSSAQRNLEPVLDPKVAKYKANELLLELKSITQLYNEYAVPFRLWEICLEILSFARGSGESDNKIVRETWNRLLDQTLSRGGVAEACSMLKRLGPKLYLADGACLPLESLCLHLEKAALERTKSGVEIVEDEDVATSLLAACMGAYEALLNIYDQLLSNVAILSSTTLRLRLLRSVLIVLHDWAASTLSHNVDSSTARFLLIGSRAQNGEQKISIKHGIRDKIGTMANRYTTEVRRLPLPQSETEAVYQGFRKLEEKLLSPT